MSISQRLFASASCALLFAGLGACPGTLADPDAFRDAAPADTGTAEPADAGMPEEESSAPCPDVPSVVFAARCGTAGCHVPSAVSPDLISPDLFARLAGQPASGAPGSLFDLDGDPDKSVVYAKLLASPPFGSRMPIGAPLDDATIACVATWIRSQAGSVPRDAGGE